VTGAGVQCLKAEVFENEEIGFLPSASCCRRRCGIWWLFELPESQLY
jgi:hypothetical protein